MANPWAVELWDGEDGVRLTFAPSEGEGSKHVVNAFELAEMVMVPDNTDPTRLLGDVAEFSGMEDRPGYRIALRPLGSWTTPGDLLAVERFLRDALLLVQRTRSDLAEDGEQR